MQRFATLGASLLEVVIAVAVLALLSLAVVSSLYVTRTVPSGQRTITDLLTKLDTAAQQIASQSFAPCVTDGGNPSYTLTDASTPAVSILKVETVHYVQADKSTAIVDCSASWSTVIQTVRSSTGASLQGEVDDRSSQALQVVTLGVANPLGSTLTKSVLKVRP